ncbi:hypothetical protein AMECASPLE_003056, partial [Ameca splendens]
KKKKTDVDVLDEIRWTSDVEVEDSSDSCVEMEEEEDGDFLLRRDPVYDQEDPELSRSSSSDNDAEEDGCMPPARKPSSEPVKRQMLAVGRGEAPMLQRKFREVLMQELIDESRAVAAAAAPKPSPSNMCLPAYYGSTATDHRRQCVLCKAEGKITKTPVYCSKCNVALCFVSDRNCFKDFHLKM